MSPVWMNFVVPRVLLARYWCERAYGVLVYQLSERRIVSTPHQFSDHPETTGTGQAPHGPATGQFPQTEEHALQVHQNEILRQGFSELITLERTRNRRLAKIASFLLPWTIIGWVIIISTVVGVILSIVGVLQVNEWMNGA